MEKLIQQNPIQLLILFSGVLAVVLGALYKLGWLRIGGFPDVKTAPWTGVERRECAQHPALNQKVCSLYSKLEDVDKKLDSVAEKLHFVLGRIEERWGKISKSD